MTEAGALRIRLEKLERTVETLRTALVDQARMLHAAQAELREVKNGRLDRDVDGHPVVDSARLNSVTED